LQDVPINQRDRMIRRPTVLAIANSSASTESRENATAASCEGAQSPLRIQSPSSIDHALTN
jgi:hypothetical protein